MLSFVSEPPSIPNDYGPDAPPCPRAPSLNAYVITKALRASLQENFGDAKAGAYSGPLNCKYYSPASGLCIVRCAREGVRYVWGAVTLLHTIDGHRVRICVRACGGKSMNRQLTAGTIRKVQRKAIAIHQNYIIQLEAAKAKYKSDPSAAPTQPLEIPLTANDIDMEDDLGVALEGTEDVGTARSENVSGISETDTELCVSPNELKVSEKVRQELLKSRNEILSITEQ